MEDDAAGGGPRSAWEVVALAFADRGVRVSAVRLAPSVYGDTDRKGFVPSLVTSLAGRASRATWATVPISGPPSIDNPTSSVLTRTQLGWQPVHPGLIADIDKGRYFVK
jgi:hypothetical protein